MAGSDPERAPLQVPRGRGTISWAEHLEVHAAYARRWPEAARRQPPERIAERGGFGLAEAEKLLGRPLRTFVARPDVDAALHRIHQG